MKLLLTSAGITNPSIKRALKKLTPKNIKIAFIPTAANVEPGDKDWLINDLVNCRKLGEVDIVDISALSKDQWLPRLEKSNVIVVGGGHTLHLMNWVNKSGLADELPDLLKDKVYLGISAGCIILSEDLGADSKYLYLDNASEKDKGLGYINFHIMPHLNSPYFPKVRDKILKDLLKNFEQDVYALDDNSA